MELSMPKSSKSRTLCLNKIFSEFDYKNKFERVKEF